MGWAKWEDIIHEAEPNWFEKGFDVDDECMLNTLILSLSKHNSYYNEDALL